VTPILLLHETSDESGARVQTHLVVRTGELFLSTGDTSLPLPPGALEAVMARYGKAIAIDDRPIGDPAALAAAGGVLFESLDLGRGSTLVRFRFLRRFDVIARDYVALFAPGVEPVCELSAGVCAALDHLARRFAARSAGV